MTGVAVELRRQGVRRQVRSLRFFEPANDDALDHLIALAACWRQHMLVERADEDEYTIAAPLQRLDGPLKRRPLQRRVEIDPGEIFRLLVLVPRLRDLSQLVVRREQVAPQRLNRMVVRMLERPARDVKGLKELASLKIPTPRIVSLLQVRGPAAEVRMLLD